MMQEIDLSRNQFRGAIPESLGKCTELTYLNLSSNDLVGEIPSQLGDMSSLRSMDLSNNNLTGMLPSTLEHLQNLRLVNVSFNNLEGPIPASGAFQHLDASSFQGNPGLCGPLIHKPCTSANGGQLGWKRSILIALASIVVTTGLVVIFCYMYRRVKPHEAKVDEDVKGLVEIRRFSAIDISRSTQDYSHRNLLGEGALGVVYKGVLSSGEVIAVKRFRDVACPRKALLQEVHILNKLRHRNLVRVLGCVLNLEVHALVLEFMPNGSLEQYLQECKTSYKLSLTMILKIAQGVANALTYLHHEYDVASIIHGDVKPSNILLDSEFEAHLADFGLAKLAKDNMGATSVSSNINGSIGYMAPEFAYAAKITTKVDIYSFGVVVLEMMTGIEPIHELLHGVTLHEWVKHKLQDGVNVAEIVHASLLLVGPSTTESEESIARILLHLAVACTEVVPDKRPTMQNIKALLVSQPAF